MRGSTNEIQFVVEESSRGHSHAHETMLGISNERVAINSHIVRTVSADLLGKNVAPPSETSWCTEQGQIFVFF